MSDLYIIQAIALENFMLHRKTSVAMASPIVLVCGANGSGKTQVLDALLLCMGYQTRRVRHCGAAAVVGKWGEEMSVCISVCNVRKASGSRVFADAPVFGEWVADEDNFDIRVTASKGEGSFRFFVRTDLTEQEVRAKALRQAFQQLGVDPGNSLSFTGEGTVGGFVDESSKSKLELLLETTGLLAARDALSKALSILKEHRSGDQMRGQRLSLEREHLQRLEKKGELLRKAEDLDRQEEGLHLEQAWCEVEAAAEKVSAYKREVDSIDEEIRTLSHTVVQSEQARRQQELEADTLQRQISAARTERFEAETTRASATTRLEMHKTRKRELEDSVREREETVDRREQEVEDADRCLEELDRALADIDSERERLQTLRAEKKSLGEQVAAADFRVRYLPQGEFAGSDYLDHALLLLGHCREQGVAELQGPLLRGLQIESPAQAGAVVDALGPDIFALVATSDRQLDSIWATATDLWQSETACPPVRVIVPRPELVAQTNGVWWRSIVTATERWAEAALCTVLEQSGMAAPAGIGRHRVIQRDHVHCLSPPVPEGGTRDLSELPHLRERLQTLLEQVADQHARVQTLERKEKERGVLVEQRRKTEEQRGQEERLLADARRKLDDLETAVATDHETIEDIDRRKPQIDNRLVSLLTRLEQQQSGSKDVVTQHLRATERLRQKREERRAVSAQMAEEERTARNRRKEAAELGEKPAKVRRSSRQIESELHGLRLMRKELDLVPLDTGQLEQQRARVKALEEEVRDGRDHAQHLDEDIRGRHRELSQQLNHLISQLGTSMTQLLAPAVSSVRLAVENVLKPDSAGLSIQVERREGETLNLESLSGGEKVLVVEALIFAFHLMVRSPLHAIDEFTQRLDMDFKAQALDMAFRTVEEATRETVGPFRPQFLLMCPDTIGVDFAPNSTFRHVVLAGVDGME